MTDLKKFRDLFNPYVEMIDRFKTDDLSGNQLTKGNIAGGLTAVGMPEHIDYGCSALLKKAMPLKESGANLIRIGFNKIGLLMECAVL